MTQAILKTGSMLDRPKSINVFCNGSWQDQKMGYVYYQGIWVPLIEYQKWIYDEGQTDYGFNFGLSSNYSPTGSLTEEENRLRLVLNSTPYSARAIAATDRTVNITRYSKLKFDLGYVGERNYPFSFGLSDSADPNRVNYVVSNYLRPLDSTREMHEIDITDLSGDFYIKFTAEMNSGLASARRTLVVYKIWLE